MHSFVEAYWKLAQKPLEEMPDGFRFVSFFGPQADDLIKSATILKAKKAEIVCYDIKEPDLEQVEKIKDLFGDLITINTGWWAGNIARMAFHRWKDETTPLFFSADCANVKDLSKLLSNIRWSFKTREQLKHIILNVDSCRNWEYYMRTAERVLSRLQYNPTITGIQSYKPRWAGGERTLVLSTQDDTA